ncbi:alpha/beta fold hydrolase [Clostridium hydrogenum]|uniref:alpha/beta fold hydrolase n=1 Tax=Clostridium hydrogenum TaxID=2855764 RepID=UPI001F206F9A|nr:alpha/beta hydrolase [Clostridium hydrogenum]
MEKIKLTYKAYGITVYHKKGDTNEKIVFVHGGALDNAMMSWKEVIELMGNKYDIYAVDMLGFGGSDKPDIQYSIPMYVEFLYDVLRQLDIDKTNLVGLSMGGGISIAFSLKYPQIVDKLTIIGSLGLYSRMPFHRFNRWFVNSRLNAKSYEWIGKSKAMVKWTISSSLFGDKNKISDKLVDDLYKLVHEPDCNKAWESFQCYELGKGGMTTDLAVHLRELSMPVLIVNGEKDSGVPVKYAIAASKVIKNSKLHVMKGCKHWAQKERPEEFVQALKDFLH